MSSRSRFAQALRGLSREAFVRFVADLWAARGWKTRIDGDVVVATREDPSERRVLLVRHPHLLERGRWTTDREDITDVVTSRSGDGPAQELADALDARVIDRTDLHDLVRYGLDPDDADRLREDYFDRSGVAEQSWDGLIRNAEATIAAVDGRIPLVFIALILVTLVVGTVIPFDGLTTAEPGGPDESITPIDVTTTFDREPTATAIPPPSPTPSRRLLPRDADPSLTGPWPMFGGGPSRTGLTAEAAGPAEGVVAVDVVTLTGSVVASPVLANDTLYVGTGDGSLYALAATSLSIRWKAPVADTLPTSPVIVDGLVYVASIRVQQAPHYIGSKSRVQAVDAGTGRLRTTVGLTLIKSELPPPVPRSSPVVTNGTLYVGGRDGTLYAVTASTGRMLRRMPVGEKILSSPAAANGTLYVGAIDGTVYAIDPTNGHIRWATSLGVNGLPSPAVSNGTLYVSAGNGTVHALDAANGRVRWRVETNGSVTPTAVANGTVYVGTSAGELIALDAATGTVQWSVDVNGSVVAAPVVATETVYVGTMEGRIHAVATTTGRVRWQYDVDGKVVASPIVVDDVLYVGTIDGRVYALRGNEAPSYGSAPIDRPRQ